MNVLSGLAIFRFDANISKTVQIGESKSLRFRVDTLNVLNHAQPAFTANTGLTINSPGTPFGQLNTKTGGRQLQGSLRFDF